MRKVRSSVAKARLAELLDDVERGEAIVARLAKAASEASAAPFNDPTKDSR